MQPTIPTSNIYVTCPIRVKKAETTDGFPWIDSPTLSPSDILPGNIEKDKEKAFSAENRNKNHNIY